MSALSSPLRAPAAAVPGIARPGAFLRARGLRPAAGPGGVLRAGVTASPEGDRPRREAVPRRVGASPGAPGRVCGRPRAGGSPQASPPLPSRARAGRWRRLPARKARGAQAGAGRRDDPAADVTRGPRRGGLQGRGMASRQGAQPWSLPAPWGPGSRCWGRGDGDTTTRRWRFGELHRGRGAETRPVV